MKKSLIFIGICLSLGLFQMGCYRSITQPVSPDATNQPPLVNSATPLVYESQFGGHGTGQSQFVGVQAIACDSHSNVYMSDSSPFCIKKFDSNGNFLKEFGNTGSGNAQVNGVIGLCVDSNDNVYVYDTSNLIKKFDSTGAYLTAWAASGTLSTGAIRGIACDNSNNIYSVDAVAQRICKFDSNGDFLTYWSTQGTWDTIASNPDGIACDQWGSVYTPDYNNSCVYKYSNTGAFKCQIGGPGSGPGKFGILSCGICIDSNGIVYVSDYAYGVVDEFNLQGKYLCQFGNTAPHALGNFDYFCVAPNGNAYVEYSDSIWIFQP